MQNICLLCADRVLLNVAPFHWWEECGVEKRPQIASKGEALERAAVRAGSEVLYLVREKRAIALSPAQFREMVERKMSKPRIPLLCVF